MKSIEQNNEMIAVFMGAVIIGKGESRLIAFPDTKIEGGGYISNNKSIKDLKYHTSWDWLMPVVEKIESLGDGDYITEFSINNHNVTLISQVNSKVKEALNLPIDTLKVRIDYFDSDSSKLQATYQAICQFIEWYNENK